MTVSESVQRLIISAPRSATFEETAMPVCSDDSVLVRAQCTAISAGTELRVYRGIPIDEAGKLLFPNMPLAFPVENGYSMVGEVIEVGAGVTTLAPGDRVFVPEPHKAYAAMPATLATKIPEAIPSEQAVFLNILEVGHIAVRRGKPAPGANVAIVGAGVIGLAALAYCRAFSCRTIAIDLDERRRAIAGEMGADLTLSPRDDRFGEQITDFCQGDGVDLAIEAAGAWPAIQTAMDVVRPGGTVIVVSRHTGASTFNPFGYPYLAKDVTLRTSYGHPPAGLRWDRSNSIAYTLELLADETIDLTPMITHRVPWQELPAVYRRLDEREKDMVGIVIDWTRTDE